MDLEYGQHYRELYEKHWWWRARERLILSTIGRIRRDGNCGSILDIGCGDGLFFDRLTEFGDVEGIESNPTLVSKETPWKARIHICSFDARFQPNKQYSLILMLDVLEHFSEPLPCLSRALELLNPRGVLVITVPAFRCLWTAHDDLNRHFTRYTKRSFPELTARAGMKIQMSRYFFHWSFPVKFFIHVKERFLHTNPRVPSIPPYLFNQAAYRLSALEQKIFDTVTLPFGTSLLIVGGRE